MKLVDLNILLYAVNRNSAHHAKAKRWVEATFSGTERVALPWPVILGFLRLATSDRILPKPLSAREALRIVDSWLELPVVVTLHPGDEHWRIIRDNLSHVGTAGNLTTDAHLAALAIEHGAELCSSDNDFSRFRLLHWSNPLA